MNEYNELWGKLKPRKKYFRKQRSRNSYTVK